MKVINLERKDKVYLSMIAIMYFLFYSICIVANIRSVEFMGIDEHSIIDSINGLTSHSYYNMNSHYHSKFYGWTYFSLNFFIIGIAKLLGCSEATTINLLVRMTHFIIGLLCSLSMFVLTRTLFKGLVALVVTFAFITNPMLSHFLNEIHPESLGLLLQILAILVLINVYQSKSINDKLFTYAVIFLSLSGLCKQAFIISNFFVGLTFLILYYTDAYKEHKTLPYKEVWPPIRKAILTFFAVFFVIHPFAFLQPIRFLSAQMRISAEHSSKTFSEVFPQWIDVLSNNPVIVLNTALVLCVPFLFKKHRLLSLSIIFSNLITAIYIYKARLWVVETYLLPTFLFSYLNVAYVICQLILKKITPAFSIIKILIVAFLALTLTTDTVYSVYKQQARYFKQGLKTKDASWSYLEKVENGTRVAYSPNIAMPDNLKEIGCMAWQGCKDAQELAQYNPELIVASLDYPHFNSSEYSKFITQNNYRVIAQFNKAPVQRTICTRPLYRNSKLYIFDISKRYRATRNCVDAYREMLDDSANNRVIDGETICIYSK